MPWIAVMIYILPLRRGTCLSSTVRKWSQHRYAFLADEDSESLAINDGRSMLAMLLAVLHLVEGLETEGLKCEKNAMIF